MSQTILDEYIAEFDKTGVQPDPTKYGFSDMLNMLVEASCVMENLGESANRSKTLKAENAELKASLNWYIGENDRQAKAWSSDWKQYLKDKQQLQDEINRLQGELKKCADHNEQGE